MDVIMEAKILKWGNSYALRLSKRDVDRMGWREGTVVRVEALPQGQKLDLDFPTFGSGHADTSVNHDEVLYGWDSDA